MLKATPGLWNDSENEKPKITEVNDYKAYHGNIIWPSHMSEWWTKQNLYPEKKKNGNRWPPDPYLIYGAYNITSENSQSLTWKSLPSPVSGIQVTQHIELQEDNQMVFRVQFKNISDSVIHWGIWFNTRLEGRANCFVRITSEKDFYIKDEGKLNAKIPWQSENGFFSFLPKQIKLPQEKIYTKACIHPKKDKIAAFWAGQMILIETPNINRNIIHPDHTFTEIYNQLMPDSKEDLLELEFHSEYKKINPGESISAFQIWKIYEAEGITEREEQISFLNQILANEN